MERHLAVFCSALMIWLLAVSGVAPVQAASNRSTAPSSISIKDKVMTMPAGSVVELKLADKRKLKGRLGTIDDVGFELQSVQGGRVLNERIPFDTVLSVKAAKHGMGTGAKVGLGMLAGVGLLFLVALIVCLAGGCES